MQEKQTEKEEARSSRLNRYLTAICVILHTTRYQIAKRADHLSKSVFSRLSGDGEKYPKRETITRICRAIDEIATEQRIELPLGWRSGFRTALVDDETTPDVILAMLEERAAALRGEENKRDLTEKEIEYVERVLHQRLGYLMLKREQRSWRHSGENHQERESW